LFTKVKACGLLPFSSVVLMSFKNKVPALVPLLCQSSKLVNAPLPQFGKLLPAHQPLTFFKETKIFFKSQT